METPLSPPELVTVIKNADAVSRQRVDGYKCKTGGGVYGVVKSIISPFIEWFQFSIQTTYPVIVYSSIVLSGEYGNSIVVWIPDMGFFIHDITATLIDDTKVQHNQGNYFITSKHL